MNAEQFSAHLKSVEAMQPGDAAVLSLDDGGSVSCVLVKRVDNTLHLRFAVPYLGRQRAVLGRANWNRVTPFPKGSMFMVTEVPA